MATDEQARLAALRRYRILDTEPEQRFDDLTNLASQICDTPISLITLIDSDRQWFKSAFGMGQVCETSRDISFCGHAILRGDIMVVPDALEDQRFADNPLVTGTPNIRFYAGAPLLMATGYALGTLCIIDTRPRGLDATDLAILSTLRQLVVQQLERGEMPDE